MKHSTFTKTACLIVSITIMALSNLNLSAEVVSDVKTEVISMTDNDPTNTAEKFFGFITAPVATAATEITDNSFQANWNTVAEVDGYELYVYYKTWGFEVQIANFDPLIITGAKVSKTSVTGLNMSTTYYYKIRAISGTDRSAYSNIVEIKTSTVAPEAPVATDASSITSSSFTANWETSIGATEYELTVYKGLPGGSRPSIVSGYNAIAVSGTSYTIPDNTLSPGTNYFYTVVATNTAGKSDVSNAIAVTTTIPTVIPNKPTEISSGSFRVNWTMVKDVDGYLLTVYTKRGLFWTNVDGYDSKVVSGTSALVSGLNMNTTYYFTLKAYVGSEESASSDEKSATTLFTAPEAPIATTASDTTTSSFTANWEASNGATEYELTVITGSPGAIGLHTPVTGYDALVVTETSYVLPESTLIAGTYYYYYVVAVNSEGKSPKSNKISVQTIFEAPVTPVATNASNPTTTSFQANWESSEGATAYELTVIEGTPGVAGLHLPVVGYDAKVISGTSHIIPENTLEPGQAYYYYVVATNTGGKSSASNNVIVNTSVPTTDAVEASEVKSDSFTANWTATAGVDGYKLYVFTMDALLTKNYLVNYNPLAISGEEIISAEVTGLDADTTYYYSVVAVIGDLASPITNVITVNTPMLAPETPIATAATNITTTSFQANWETSEGAEEYRMVIVKGVPGVVGLNPKVMTWTGIHTHYPSSDMFTPNTDYFYYIVAINAGGESGYSDTITVKTLAIQDTLTLSADPFAGGSVTGDGTYERGTSVTAQAIADEGYEFVNWTEDGIEVSTDANFTFDLDDNRTLVANFTTTTSLNDENAIQFKVFPNPATHALYVSNISSGSVLKLRALSGQTVLQKSQCNETETLDINSLKSGIYILTIENAKGQYSQKIVKQ